MAMYVNNPILVMVIFNKNIKDIFFIRLYLSANASINSLEDEKYKFVVHRTVAFNLEVDLCALQITLLNKIISAEKPELNVNNERNRLDLLYLKQKQKNVHVSMEFGTLYISGKAIVVLCVHVCAYMCMYACLCMCAGAQVMQRNPQEFPQYVSLLLSKCN